MSSSAQLTNALHGAHAIAAQGDKRGALALLDQALGNAVRTLGPDDPDVLAATGQLARYHIDLGELADARRVLEEGLAAGYNRLGNGHAVMLALSYELARLADELGNVFEAKRRYNQLAKLGPQALGEQHPSVRAAREYLGLPEPGGDGQVSPAPTVTFDPVTPPPRQPQPQVTQPAPEPEPIPEPEPEPEPVDERTLAEEPVSPPPSVVPPLPPLHGFGTQQPVYRPEPREDDQPTLSLQQLQEQERQRQLLIQQQQQRQQPPPRPQPQEYQPAPWQRTAPGVLQRADYEPMSGPSWQVAPAPSSATAPPLPIDEVPRRRRSPMLAIVVIVIVAVLGGGAAAAIAFFAKQAGPDGTTAGPPTGTPASSAAPAASHATLGGSRAPHDLKLKDDKTSITLTWKDPSPGTVPFVVAGGSQGAMRELQGLPAGTTKYTISGLNAKLEYCFTVAAVYGTQDVQLSDLACTKRK
ncbi:fibronectin type III domain-containing protein [Dactylosporangium darangshiense]|uniref:Fibronectin type-III domain-containing protein n=1 Tax=Dactylosporangium darangshiense TaxID=579108 RepID=A0ABP8D1C7_9ACTN